MHDDTDALLSLRDWVRWGASRMLEVQSHFGHGCENAFDEAAYLVLHALHLPPQIPGSYFGARLTTAERQRVRELLDRRIASRAPAAYLTQHARFAGLDFFVDERVLVPRSPVAELIEAGFEPWLGGREPARLLDLCTGSGCIAVALAYAFPDSFVDATDLSPEALEVARINVEGHGLAGRIELLQGDLFAPVTGRGYDLIVSNPPYVSDDEMMALPREYHYEPRLGLAAGAEGLDVAARILGQAARHLRPEGLLVLEVGDSAEALVARCPEVPFVWVDLGRGGQGVLVLTREQLIEHCTDLARL